MVYRTGYRSYWRSRGGVGPVWLPGPSFPTGRLAAAWVHKVVRGTLVCGPFHRFLYWQVADLDGGDDTRRLVYFPPHGAGSIVVGWYFPA